MGYYPFLIISLNGHNSSQEQDRDMPQETFLFRITCLKHAQPFFLHFDKKKKIVNTPEELANFFFCQNEEKKAEQVLSM